MPNAPLSLIFIRHTAPAIAPGICYGQSDLDLAQSFDEEWAQILPQIPVANRIFSSPLQRCRKLAQKIAQLHGMDVEIDARLIEMDFGRWEEKPWADIPRYQLDIWQQDFFHARPHGGESVAMLRTRVLSFLNEISSKKSGIPLCITHAGVMKTALATNLKPESWQRTISYGEIIPYP